MITDVQQLSGLQKVAIVFSVLGENLALTLIKDLSKTEIRKIRATLQELPPVSFAVKKRVFEEFYFNFVSDKFQESDEDTPKKPFDFLNQLTDEQLISLLVAEEPRVAAIALAQVSPEKKTMVVDRMAPDMKARVLIELGNIQDVPLEGIVSVAQTLEEKSHFLPRTVSFSRGGAKEIADVLAALPPEEEEKFLSTLAKENPKLAQEVKKYHLMFDDIFELFPDNILRDLMNSVDLDTIALAMKGLPEDLVQRVIGNLPQKKQAMYEPVEGPVLKREVDKARKVIVQQAREMEKEGAFKLEDLASGGEMIE
ncbi:MAG: hypothetical protein D6762_05700 [Candidatus Neomarinimicrobiota bacterium]|nr:MAG: hypothetical protein D6762_05700 [Candidatus Neomarinimicrobiota bacterium]